MTDLVQTLYAAYFGRPARKGMSESMIIPELVRTNQYASDRIAEKATQVSAAVSAAASAMSTAGQAVRRAAVSLTPYGLTFTYQKAVDLSALAGKPWLRHGRKRRQ